MRDAARQMMSRLFLAHLLNRKTPPTNPKLLLAKALALASLLCYSHPGALCGEHASPTDIYIYIHRLFIYKYYMGWIYRREKGPPTSIIFFSLLDVIFPTLLIQTIRATTAWKCFSLPRTISHQLMKCFSNQTPRHVTHSFRNVLNHLSVFCTFFYYLFLYFINNNNKILSY